MTLTTITRWLLATTICLISLQGTAQQANPEGLKSEFLFELVLDTAEAQRLGDRSITPIKGGKFSGPALNGTVMDLGADWVRRDARGISHLDVRITLKTDDGELIYMTYRGVISRGDSGLYWRVTPTFETAAEKYAWLNGIIAVGVGSRIDGKVGYHIYRIL